jgi:hypothetical protein
MPAVFKYKGGRNTARPVMVNFNLAGILFI